MTPANATGEPRTALLFRSPANHHHFLELSSLFPQLDWCDAAMPELPGYGTSTDERTALHLELSRTLEANGPVDLVVYSRAYGAFTAQCRAALTALFGVPTITATGAVLNQLASMNVSQIHLVTPYTEDRHHVELEWLESNGFDVGSSACLGKPIGDEIAALEPESLSTLISQASTEQTVYVACTMIADAALKLAGGRPGVPVLGATAALINEIRNWAEAPERLS